MKKLLVILSLALFPIFGQNTVEIVDKSGLELLTPSLSERKTKKIRLSNGLEAYLISDPTTANSAAAIAVGVGSGEDPDNHPGLAHFVEHLLFMGNEKYPHEEDFSLFLDRFGGKKNACTMSDRTMYFFSCLNEGFFEGLDHIAHFFQHPLFTTSSLKRECKAVHQEYARNVNIDHWRKHYLKKNLTNKNHPFHRFCIGNLDTLSDVKSEEIRNWFDSHYSANIMKLCVYSNAPLDQLEEAVVASFSSIKNIQWQREEKEESLNNQPMICFAPPLQEQNYLEICWPIDFDPKKRLETHIDHFMSHILGQEGKESLLSQLKQEKLAYKIDCDLETISQNQAYFVITADLTQKGVKEYEQVICKIYEAINGLKKAGLAKHLYDEVCTINKLAYEYQTRSDLFDYVLTQAIQLLDEPLESYPSKTIIPSSFEPLAFQEFLASLKPDKALYLLLADPHLTGIEPTEEEQWLKVPYTAQQIEKDLLIKWATNDAIDIQPAPNPFIPLSLEKKESVKTDQLFSLTGEWKDPRGVLYSIKDLSFFTPEIYWKLHLKSAAVTPASTKSLVLAELFASGCGEHLNEKFYSAKVAALNFSLSAEVDGIALQVQGFEEKASLLLQELAKEIHSFQFTPELFALTKESLATTYDLKLSSAMDHALEGIQEIIFQEHATFNEKKTALQEISLEEVNLFIKKIFESGYIETSFFGNSKENPEVIWKKMLDTLAFAPFPKEDHITKKAALFSISEPFWIEKFSKQPAGALVLTIDFGAFDHKKRAAQQVLSKALHEPFFDELRTKQQTAYVVQCWDQEIEKHLYNFFATLSSSHDPKDLLARFECFLEGFVQNLEEKHLTKERFEDIRRSAILNLRSPQLSFSKTGALAHQLLFEYNGDLNWLKKREKALETLTYEECIEIGQEIFGRKNPKRIAIIVNGTYPTNLFRYEASSIKNLKEKLQYFGKAQ